MEIRYTRIFQKQYKKLSSKLQIKFNERLRLWVVDPTQPQLRVHPLQGSKKGYWSMNISGDLRALYYFEGETLVVFAMLGTHSQLY